MSFYINNTNSSRPGPLGNNGINGLCEKVLIETTKVFDACVCQSTETGVVLTLSDLNPENPTLPLTYISAQSTTSTPVISDLNMPMFPRQFQSLLLSHTEMRMAL